MVRPLIYCGQFFGCAAPPSGAIPLARQHDERPASLDRPAPATPTPTPTPRSRPSQAPHKTPSLAACTLLSPLGVGVLRSTFSRSPPHSHPCCWAYPSASSCLPPCPGPQRPATLRHDPRLSGLLFVFRSAALAALTSIAPHNRAACYISRPPPRHPSASEHTPPPPHAPPRRPPPLRRDSCPPLPKLVPAARYIRSSYNVQTVLEMAPKTRDRYGRAPATPRSAALGRAAALWGKL